MFQVKRRQARSERFSINLALLVFSLWFTFDLTSVIAQVTEEDVGEFTITAEGKEQATIVIAEDVDTVSRFAAREFQYHVQKITGVLLPVVTDRSAVKGNRVLIGESAATRELGLKNDSFERQEYMIRFLPDTLILMGRDELVPRKSPIMGKVLKTQNADLVDVRETKLPETYEDQGTCYAVYDFLERFCSIRWFAPTELGMVFRPTQTLRVKGKNIRRSPFFVFRQGSYMPVYGFLKVLWNNPSPEEVKLFARRMRLGGEPYAANHSLYGYYDRFWSKNLKHPEFFEMEHPDWFAQGYSNRPPQMCYTNRDLIEQVIQDALEYFGGKGTKPGVRAEGDFFPLVPMDNSSWCKCSECQAQINQGEINSPFFSRGYASDYYFGFVNKVARGVNKSYPGKKIATLAYSSYAYYPESVRLEPNIAVQLCLHVRNWWSPGMEQNDMRFYKRWITREKDRPIYLWLYYCFPEEEAIHGKYHCFPGFFAHTIDRQFKMFAADKIRGILLNNLGEYLDNYLTFKLLDDPFLSIETLIDEFHQYYYGPAAEPMKKFYLRVEEIYSNFENYPPYIQIENKHFHQNEELAWAHLGTKARMKELRELIEAAASLATTPQVKKRIELFREGIWDYMVEGKRAWDLKQSVYIDKR